MQHVTAGVGSHEFDPNHGMQRRIWIVKERQGLLANVTNIVTTHKGREDATLGGDGSHCLDRLEKIVDTTFVKEKERWNELSKLSTRRPQLTSLFKTLQRLC